MRLLTIGDFARQARLTPKALRLYDRLGLLRPAAVDPDSGYRLYDPDQLRRARLVARLREIEMPLAEIREVCAREPAGAAEAVAAYWRRVTEATTDRGRRAALLVSELSGKDTSMSFRVATRCETARFGRRIRTPRTPGTACWRWQTGAAGGTVRRPRPRRSRPFPAWRRPGSRC